MMEMSMWNENILLGDDWGLDLPFHQEFGPFGDLKPTGHDDGINLLGFQPQEADCPASGEAVTDEGNLDSWMESSDLAAYLHDLGGNDPKLVPVDSSLHELTSLLAPEQQQEEVVYEDQQEVIYDDQVDLFTSSIMDVKPAAVLEVFGSDASFSGDHTFDALASPPVSPEQVAPVINIQTVVPAGAELKIDNATASLVFTPDTTSGNSIVVDQAFLEQLDFSNVSQVKEDPFMYLDEAASELINSPLSADDVDSMLSVSEPASPRLASSSPAHSRASSIFESSPELYKVISTSSPEGSARFSPYQKSRPVKKESKVSKRTPAQPVPEHVISGQVNKKDRKKLQNKNAAIRYRQKKKEEANGIKSEEQELEEYNAKLKSDVEDIEREIRYMKSLMEEIYRAKGQI